MGYYGNEYQSNSFKPLGDALFVSSHCYQCFNRISVIPGIILMIPGVVVL